MLSGEMQEWLNWHAWKACVPQKGTGGSNPPLSAFAPRSPAWQDKGEFLYWRASADTVRKLSYPNLVDLSEN